METEFIEAWKKKRKSLLMIALSVLALELPLVWYLIQITEKSLERYLFLVFALLPIIVATVISYRKLTKLSECPSCKVPLFDILSLVVNKKLKLVYCPCCGKCL